VRADAHPLLILGARHEAPAWTRYPSVVFSTGLYDEVVWVYARRVVTEVTRVLTVRYQLFSLCPDRQLNDLDLRSTMPTLKNSITEFIAEGRDAEIMATAFTALLDTPPYPALFRWMKRVDARSTVIVMYTQLPQLE